MEKKLIIFILLLFICTGCVITQTSIENNSIPIETIEPLADAFKIEIKKESLKLYDEGFKKFKASKYSEAINLFEQALKIDSNNYKALCGKGFSLGFFHKYDEAHEFIDKGLEINPKYGYGYYIKAFVYKLNKELDNSLKYFEYSIEYDKTNAWAFFGISTIYADRGIADKSIEYLKEAVKLNPSAKTEAIKQSHFDTIRHLKEFKEVVEG